MVERMLDSQKWLEGKICEKSVYLEKTPVDFPLNPCLRFAAGLHSQPQEWLWYLWQQRLQDELRSKKERPSPSDDCHNNPRCGR